MSNLMFEDKSGQPELFNIQSTSSDSEGASDSEEEGEWARKVKQESTSLSSCWADITSSISQKKNTLTKRNLGVAIPENKNDEIDLNDVYVDIGDHWQPINSSFRKVADQDDLLKDTVIGPEFHRLHEVPSIAVQAQKSKKQRREEKQKTAGSKWFNMPAPEMTEALQKDIDVIKMRSVLDPKQFYKKNTMTQEMKYFQLGRIVESSADFYHSRIPKKERKKTLVDELLANSEFKKYNRRRYKEILSKTMHTDGKARKHANKLKKKKK